MDRSGMSLNNLLGRLTETQMSSLKDAQGWTIKDHIIHMIAWERPLALNVADGNAAHHFREHQWIEALLHETPG